MRIVFAGTPEFAVPALAALVGSEHQIVAVYTQPDRPAGRGRQLQMSPVKQLALKHQLPVVQPFNFQDATSQRHLADLKPDLMVVAAYGLLLPQEVVCNRRVRERHPDQGQTKYENTSHQTATAPIQSTLRVWAEQASMQEIHTGKPEAVSSLTSRISG